MEEQEDWESIIEGVWNEYKEIKDKDKKKTFAYGKLWELTRVALERSWKEYSDVRIRGAILTVGFSPEPIAGTLSAVRPDYACLLHTSKSEKVIEEVLLLSGFPRSKIRLFKVSKDDVSSLYEKFREAIRFLVVEQGINKEEIVLDPTGGTKTMPFAGGIVGLSYNLSLLYVSNERYDPEERRPIAGHEFFVFKPKLASSYSIREYLHSVKLISRGSFHNSLKIWEQIYDEEIPSHRLLFYFSKGLSFWDSFRYDEAIECFRRVLKVAPQFRSESTVRAEALINEWIGYLKKVKENDGWKSTDYLCHAIRLFNQGNGNVCVIMLYVSLETFVEWLSREKGIDRQGFTEAAKEFETAKSVLSRFKRDFKGGKLGLVEGLAALSYHYPIEQKHIGQVMTFAKLRNDVVHRGESANEDKLLEFIQFLKDFFRIFTDELGVDKEFKWCDVLSEEKLNFMGNWLEEISWK